MIGTAILIAAGGYLTRDRWMQWLGRPTAEQVPAETPLPRADVKVLKVSPQARKNMGLVSKPVTLETYWRTILLPGEIVDRPGVSDRGITSPAVGTVAEVHAFPGDTIRPGDRLFTLRVFSEYLQNTQSELFKAARETVLLDEQRKRLAGLSREGAIAEVRIIEIDNQLRRQNALLQAYRQDLLTRGFQQSQIDGVAEGRFVSTIEIVAPPHTPVAAAELTPEALKLIDDRQNGPTYEVQELKVDLLYIEGRGFKGEASLLARAAENRWPVEAEFAEDDARTWPPLEQTLTIRHLANTMDPASRTFGFFLLLVNQSRRYEHGGKTFLVWRFRPGQRVRLRVPVEELPGDPVEGRTTEYTGVIVLPRTAVVREGPEAYVFRANGDAFDRKPVHVLFEDRHDVVLANDGSVAPGLFVAHNAAAALQRVLKAQTAGASGHEGHSHAH